MFCLQEKETHFDKDPLDTESQSELSDDEPASKRLKLNPLNPLNQSLNSTLNSSLNLQVYQIPANYNYSNPKSLSIFPSSHVLPKFVNNPLNLANPLALANEANNIVKNLQTRFSLPAKLTITPVQKNAAVSDSGEIIRYKKNGEVAKKRGPPKGYKRKPKLDLSKSLSLPPALQATALQAQNTILTSLLASNNTSVSLPPTTTSALNQTRTILPHDSVPPLLIPIAPPIRLPEGVELVELHLDPMDWFPSEPYKMTFSRKKNPKWKLFPFRCEHCFKGYRVPTTLLQHCAERHGSVPRQLAVPCPCCAHVSVSRKMHKKHLETHGGRRRRIFCLYCIPPPQPSEPYIRESEKYPFDKCPQYWYASEESLRLHKKRKHPYSAMMNYNWFCMWRDCQPNS